MRNENCTEDSGKPLPEQAVTLDSNLTDVLVSEYARTLSKGTGPHTLEWSVLADHAPQVRVIVDISASERAQFASVCTQSFGGVVSEKLLGIWQKHDEILREARASAEAMVHVECARQELADMEEVALSYGRIREKQETARQAACAEVAQYETKYAAVKRKYAQAMAINGGRSNVYGYVNVAACRAEVVAVRKQLDDIRKVAELSVDQTDAIADYKEALAARWKAWRKLRQSAISRDRRAKARLKDAHVWTEMTAVIKAQDQIRRE